MSMLRTFSPFVFFFLALAACDGGSAPSSADESPAIVLAPRAAAPDLLISSGRTRSLSDPFDLFSGSIAGRALSEHLRVATRYDDFAARRYRMSLARLKSPELSRQAVAELASAYARLPSAAYDQRWLIVHTLGELERSDALDALADVAARTVPAAIASADESTSSPREEEISIRLAAVRGIARLAQLGYRGADDQLLALARTSTVLAVQLQAVQAYLNAARIDTRATSLAAYRQTRAFAARADVVRRTLPRELQGAITAQPMQATVLQPVTRPIRVHTPAPTAHR